VFAAALEGFAQGCGDLGFAVSVVAHAGCFITALQELGSKAQHEAWLPKLMSGEWVAGIGNAEPRGGTDIMSIRARVKRQGDGFVAHARKRSITNVGPADLVAFSARLEGEDAHRAINVFLAETAGPRIKQRPLTDLGGLRTSPTGDLLAWRAPLGPLALLGKPGTGLKFFKAVFSLERLLIGYLYLAAIRRSLVRAVHHAETRTAFGDAIGRNQYVQDKIVRMRMSEELLSAQLDRTLARFVDGEDVFASLSIIKAWGVAHAREAAEDLVALLGARGLRQSERAEKDVRDLLGLSILGGTQELQKMVIYRETVKSMTSTPTANKGPEGVTIEVRSHAEVDRSLEQALVALANRAIPNEPSLAGRYYYDSIPDSVVVARVDGQVVGVRTITRRSVLVGERAVKLAGIGIAVDPDYQRRGVGRRLTAATLELLHGLGDELVVAFLFSRNAESLLTGFGFRRLAAEVSYTARASNERVVEQMPCFVRDLAEDGLVADLEARGRLHLGLGTW
jgi:alkylation response protein AidB-like acyl-CoA dehydrogenase/GNAT superfamily N-acetyltransferase